MKSLIFQMTEVKTNDSPTEMKGNLFSTCVSEKDPNKVDSSRTYYVLVGRYARTSVCMSMQLREDVQKNEFIEIIANNILKPSFEKGISNPPSRKKWP